jgi:ABC-type sugar transport system substrate-binding protein
VGTRLMLGLVNDVSEYQRLVKSDTEAAARRHGFSVEVQNGEDNVTTQIRQIRDCIRRPPEERPYAILAFPARDASVDKVAQEAVRAGVGWIVLNRRADYLGALRDSAPHLPIGMVGPDQVEVGRLQARQALALLPGGGYMLYVMGITLASAAQDRLAGLKDGLKGSKVTFGEVAGSWHSEEADRAVGAWLEMVVPSGLRLGMVSCQNDAMAQGARTAVERVAVHLKRPEIAGVPVTGVDGIETFGQRLVGLGRLTATVVQPSSGGPAVDLLASCLKGAPMPATTVLPLTSYPPLDQLTVRGR